MSESSVEESKQSSVLEQLARALDDVALAVFTGHLPLGELPTPVDADDHDLHREALLGHIRTCLVLVLQRGGPDDLRAASRAVSRVSSLATTRTTASEIGPLTARLHEWARLPAVAAARRGSTAAEQVLRGWKGKSQFVVDELARHDQPLRRVEISAALADADMAIGDQSALSKILLELDQAGLVRRWKEGRETIVELTAAGARHTAATATPSPPMQAERRWALVDAVIAGPEAVHIRRAYSSGSSVGRLATPNVA